MGNTLSSELFEDSYTKEDKPRVEKKKKRSRTLRRKQIEHYNQSFLDYNTDDEELDYKNHMHEDENQDREREKDRDRDRDRDRERTPDKDQEKERERDSVPPTTLPKKKRKVTYKSRNNN